VRTARAKGLPEWIVIGKHALRNTLIPIVTVAGHQFGNLFAGAVLVETVYTWPGLGRLLYDSVLSRDTPMLAGVLLLSAALVVSANLLADIFYRLLDPRLGFR
jgi:peptide/nickel transport system permease protein